MKCGDPISLMFGLFFLFFCCLEVLLRLRRVKLSSLNEKRALQV
jgi:hypothetical protein